MSFLEILLVICECPEYSELPVRHGEDEMNLEFAQQLPIGLDPSRQSPDSPHTKAFLLLQAHLLRRDMPSSDYRTDLKSVLDRTIPIIQALVDIAAEEAQWRTSLNLIALLQCIHQAAHPWQSSLMAGLPYLSNERVLKRLKDEEKIEHLAQLVESWDAREQLQRAFNAESRSLQHIPAHTQKRMVRDIYEVSSKLPRLRVALGLFEVDTGADGGGASPRAGQDEEETFNDENEGEKQNQDEYSWSPWRKQRGEGGTWRRRRKLRPSEIDRRDMTMKFELRAGIELELEAYLWYDNNPMKFAYAPKFPKKKTYSWWCLLGDAENDELIQMKRVLMEPCARRYQKRTAFEFEVPDEDPGEVLRLDFVCLSDSFVGLDQQYAIEITVVE